MEGTAGQRHPGGQGARPEAHAAAWHPLHKQLARKLNIQVFFCDPYRPGQRGTNENTNGLLREFLPKGLDLSPFTDDDLASLEFVINNRPRRVPGYRTPQEVFDELCAQHAKATPQRPPRRR